MLKKLILISALLFALITPSFSATLLPYPKFKAFDTSGNPLSGGKLYTYYPGTTTPKPAYSDKDITVEHTNPIILDSVGECNLYLSGQYKLVLKTSVDALVWTMDNLPTNDFNSPEILLTEFMDGLAGRPAYATWYANQGTTNLTAVIEAAKAGTPVDGILIFPVGTFATTGGHTFTTQKVMGTSKTGTIIKRLSGKSTIFTLLGTGSIENLTIDGNSTNGSGITVTTNTYPTYSPGSIKNVLFKNFNPSVVTKNITGATNAGSCQITSLNHGFSDGDLVSIKDVNGFKSASYPDISIIDGTYRVSNCTTHTFTIPQNTIPYTVYVNGGTVENATYALTVEQLTGIYAAHHKTFDDLEFWSNYGHIYLGYCNYATFNRTQMFGFTTGYAVYLSSLDVSTNTFNDTYMESGIATSHYGLRNLAFNNTSVYLSTSQAWDRPWWYSYGMNDVYGTAGGEVAQIRFNNLDIYRLVSDSTNAIFDANNYQMTLNNVHIIDDVSNPWYVFRDRGTKNLRLDDITVESSGAWDLFYPYDAASNTIGGRYVEANNVNYTQGVIGTATWPSIVESGGSSGHVSVRNSNLNHAIADSGAGGRGYIFENITGDIDLTYSSVGGTYLFNVFGTITDPNQAVTFHIRNNGNGIIMNPYYTYDDNAAALTGGVLVEGDIYKTPTGVLMRVYTP